jgi:hypothetical protein
LKGIEIKGEVMPIKDVLRLIKFDELTNEQKSELTQKFQARKRELQAAMKAIDQGLAALARKRKPRRAAK